jgi:hypothetical protein
MKKVTVEFNLLAVNIFEKTFNLFSVPEIDINVVLNGKWVRLIC